MAKNIPNFIDDLIHELFNRFRNPSYSISPAGLDIVKFLVKTILELGKTLTGEFESKCEHASFLQKDALLPIT